MISKAGIVLAPNSGELSAYCPFPFYTFCHISPCRCEIMEITLRGQQGLSFCYNIHKKGCIVNFCMVAKLLKYIHHIVRAGVTFCTWYFLVDVGLLCCYV